MAINNRGARTTESHRMKKKKTSMMIERGSMVRYDYNGTEEKTPFHHSDEVKTINFVLGNKAETMESLFKSNVL